MGRTYAGILGPIAFGVIVARCLAQGGNVASALCAAPLALFAFAFIGYIIGSIAERTIVEAIEAKFHAQLQAEEGARSATISGNHPVSRSDTQGMMPAA
jgi:hypothetical protein